MLSPYYLYDGLHTLDLLTTDIGKDGLYSLATDSYIGIAFHDAYLAYLGALQSAFLT